LNLEDVLDNDAHIAFYEWKALGGDEPCQCIHCKRYRFSKIPNEVVVY